MNSKIVNKKILSFFLVPLLIGQLLSFSFPHSVLAACVCGDGYCNPSCENSSNCPEDCGPSCTDECSYSGQRRCYCSTQYQVCGNYDSDPCLEWSSPQNCPPGQVCQNGYCLTTCQNECSYSGQIEKRCSDNNVQKRTCGNYDPDPCLEWSSWTTIQNCGQSGWTDEYRCSSSRYLQRKWVERGCSNAQCFANSEWRTVQDCGTDICIGSTWRDYYCSSGSCYHQDIACSSRCFYCGDGVCNSECSETTSTCPQDCGYPQLNVYCSASPNPAQVNQSVTFTAYPSGGTGSYTYSWTGACRCNSKTCTTSFSQAGTYTANVTVTSGNQTKSASCSVTVNPIPCQCGPWSDWRDKGCGQGGCPSNKMWQERTRHCHPPGCDIDSETRCIDHPSCQPNDPVSGTLTSSCQSFCTGEYVTFTISAQDNQGVEKVCLRPEDASEDCKSCSGNTSCSRNWQTTRNSPGNYTFYGRVFGRKPDGSSEWTTTNPPSLTIEFRQCCTLHHHQACYDNDVYWYDSCSNREEKAEECGDSGWTDKYQCSGNWVQRKWMNRGCSNAQCFASPEWKNFQDCQAEGKICQNGQCVLPPNRPPSANAGPDKEVLETQTVVLEGSGSDPDGDPITFSWTCTGGSLSNPNISQPTFTALTVSADTSFSCTLTVTDSRGTSTSDSMNVLVKNQTLFVSLEAIPSSGSAPLYGVDLKATVSGTAVGTINYKFDCTSDGTWEHTFYGTSENPKTVVDACNYLSGGTYNAKVYVERGAAEPAWAQATILVSSPWPIVDLKANGSDGPITIAYNTSATLTWTSSNTTSCYASGDWSGAKALSGSESTGNLTSSKTYTITCSGPGGTTSDSVTVNVTSLSLFVSLSALPSSGCLPLENVDLTATVSGTASGNITYFFDCTNDGAWEKIVTTSNESYTASDLCNFTSTGTYTAKVKVERQGLSAENITQINVYSCYVPAPTVDLKANGSDGPITIPYNTSATLTWISANTTSCYASGDWSGAKTFSGSESTGNLISTKTYTITCSGPGGSASDSLTIYVGTAPAVGRLSLRKLAQNISKATPSGNTIYAEPGEIISFTIYVKAGDVPVRDITLRDTLPPKMRYRGNLKIEGVSSGGDILTGLNIGDLSAYQRKTITFEAEIFSAEYFPFGETHLTNSASAFSNTISASDTAKIIVQKKAVAGITTIPTGLTNNFFLDSFFLPLVISFGLIWLFRSKIINFEEWLEKRKRKYLTYKSQKLLQSKIAQIRAKEFLTGK